MRLSAILREERFRAARIAVLSLALVVELFFAFGQIAGLRAGEGEKTVLGSLLSKALSTPSSQVSIGAIDGALSADAVIRDVVISDRDGAWLKLDRARLVWRRLALLSRRLEIDSLELGRLEVLRKPLPGPTPQEAAPDGTLLPELPVKVEIKGFKLVELVLGESVAGQPARLAADGKARLGDPSEGLDLSIDARRLDAAGRFVAKLLFVPKGEKLELKASLVEPAGGLLSKAGNLPGTPPIDFDLDGRGTLDSWNARLDFEAGPEIGAKGGARVSRIGKERRLSLDLASRIEGLVPGPAAAIFSGVTKLEGGLAFSDAGAFRIDRLDLTSRTARLTMAGGITPERVADLTIQARAVPTEGGLTKAGEAELESLAFDGSVKGPLSSPSVKGVLKAAGLRTRESALDRVEASVSAEPLSPDKQGARFALAADAKMDGLSLSDPALRRAIGGRAALTFRATSTPDGVIDVSTLKLDADTAALRYSGTIGQNTLSGNVEATLADLGVFSGVAGRGLAGRLDLKAALSGDPARKAVAADLSVRGQDLVLGIEAADRLLGRAPTLTGRVAQTYDGYGFEAVKLAGAEIATALQGQATSARADVTARVDLTNLAALDARLTGRAGLDARLTGSLEKPDLTASLSAPEASANGQPIRNLRVEAALADLTGALAGRVSLSGDIAGKPLSGEARLAHNAQDWSLERLAFALGSVAVEGRAGVDAGTALAEGALTIRAGNLGDLSPLALAPMAGSLDAAVSLAREGGRQDAAIRATGASLRYDTYGLAKLDADLNGRDLRARPVLDGRLNADRIAAAGQIIDTLRLAAVGTPSASDVTLSAQARGFNLDGAARLVPGDSLRVELQRFSAARGGDRLALAGPATVTLEDGAAVVDGLGITAGAGRVSVQGRAGRTLDLTIGIRALPLALARIARSDLALSGTLDGQADIKGSAERPEGHYALSVSGLVAPETRKAGLPPIDVKASGTLSEGSAGIDARIAAGKGVAITLTGSVPVEPGGALNLKARGTLDAALANSMLSTGGQRVTGSVALDAGVTGTLAQPRVEGGATLSGGSLTDPLNGIRITDIAGRVTGRGDAIVIERLTAATRNGGRLAIDGRIALEPASGFPGSLKVSAERAELISSELMTAVASLNLTLSGPLARSPRISGRVDVVSIDVAVPDRMPASVQPLPGIRHVNATPETRARLAKREAKAVAPKRKGKAAASFDAALDLTVSAPNRIFVRGRGIDAELGGELRVTGSSRDPRANGEFELRRGRLALVGQRLDFTRGRLSFAGDLATPELDFLAQTKAADVTARVAVTGPANQPAFALTSDPMLAQDEVLSRILFKKASGGLSPFQAVQLAQAVAQLSGGSSGPDVLDSARKKLGLDSLDIETGSTGGPTVGASRYISDKLSVGVKAGAKPADTAATVDYDVTRRIKLKGEAGSDGRTAVGVGAEWEW